MLRILFSTGNIFISLVLGALAFGYVFLNHPEAMRTIFLWAGGLKSWLISRGLSSQYNNWIDLLLEERQLAFMGFTIAVRFALGVLVSFGSWLFGRTGARPETAQTYRR